MGGVGEAAFGRERNTMKRCRDCRWFDDEARRHSDGKPFVLVIPMVPGEGDPKENKEFRVVTGKCRVNPPGLGEFSFPIVWEDDRCSKYEPAQRAP